MGVWNWDAASDVVNLDAKAASIFGIDSGHEVTWKKMQTLIDPADAERARQQVIYAVNNRTDYDIEYKLAAQGREGAWVLAKGRAFYDAGGAVLGMRGVVLEVTDRKRWEEKLKASTHELAMVLRNVPDVIARYGPDL
jgi:PAS domain S-box-containing protein